MMEPKHDARRSGQRVVAVLVLLLAAAGCAVPDATDGSASAMGRMQDGLLHSPYGYEVAPPPPPSPPATGYARYEGYFPNTELTTSDGRRVRFYDDLVRGKIVLINFMYTQCTGI